MYADTPDSPPRRDKGKAPALPTLPTEHTPLLSDSVTSSRTRSIADNDEERLIAPTRQSSFRSILLSVFCVSLSLCVLLFVLLALLAYSYGSGASREAPDTLIRRSLVLRGPDRVDVLNISYTDGIWLRVEGRVGVDAGAALGVNPSLDDGVFKDIWKSVGRWGVERVENITVNLSTVSIHSEHGHLADISFPPSTLPLTVNPPQDFSWLTPMSVPVLFKPTNDSKLLARFIRDTWRDGVVNVRAVVDEAVVSVLHGRFHLTREDVSSTVRIALPPLPPLDQVPVTLLSFLIQSTPTNLILSGNATIENPVPPHLNVRATLPTLPFLVSLPANDSSVPVANVTTAPMTLSYPNITMSISGTVLPIRSTGQAALSRFLSVYLQAEPNPILISSPFLPDLQFPALFPAPIPKPQVLRNVTIRNMFLKYHPDGNTMLASGTVYGRAVLPKGIQVGLDVKRLFPDVLVFDGEVPSEEEEEEEEEEEDSGEQGIPHLPHVPHPRLPHISDLPRIPIPSLPLPTVIPSLPSILPKPHVPLPVFPIGRKHRPSRAHSPPPKPSLPDPLPPRAFAHIRPEDWLPTICTPVAGDGKEGTTVEVEAKIVDVPLEVLPGRDKEFRSFVGKVIFSNKGALAGVQGTAAVGVHILGLPVGEGEGSGEMELVGLPFAGRVMVGKGSAF
ncbi:hypothetical protein BXZ70DRAFT_962531 [Cristinia sonorae]|uniref:Pre-rRNA processing protein n=1 Tax=Cristinia sonorae TaxID=1940300 RepID=A0A8K0UE34_9AGAR|nr:hypothetical protein BXZ70DRAFT_962531 [Cristinia sonorae]